MCAEQQLPPTPPLAFVELITSQSNGMRCCGAERGVRRGSACRAQLRVCGGPRGSCFMTCLHLLSYHWLMLAYILFITLVLSGRLPRRVSDT